LKHFVYIILFCFISLPLYAQVKKPQNDPGYDFKLLHFGFTVGLNTMDMGIKRNLSDGLLADVTRIEPGFQVTIVSDLRLTDDLNLRFLPGIAFGQRNIAYYQVDSLLRSAEFVREIRVESSFLEFPLLLKYRSERLNNCRPYLIGGINFRYDMAARKEYNEEENVLVRLKPADIYLEAGFGIDYYLAFFKFAPEIKVGMGLTNLRVKDPSDFAPQYVRSMERITSYVVMLNFHFE